MLMSLSACSLLEDNAKVIEQVPSIPVIDTKNSLEQTMRCGNKPYRYAGRNYHVLPSSQGYRAEGGATVFRAGQDKQTAGCEKLDLGSYVAAHRTLPLPSYVRVINRNNGLSVVVRVNERGPFDSSALIQLSTPAAKALQMSGARQTPVVIEGIAERSITQLNNQPLHVSAKAGLENSNKSAEQERRNKVDDRVFYVIVGRYPTQAAAIDTFIRLASAGLGKAEMATAQHQGNTIHQVRIGPLYTQDQIDNVKSTLESNGLTTFRVVGIKDE